MIKIAFSNTSGGKLIIGVNSRSETRNKVIANVFKELGLIEQWGSGINRIKTSCEQNGLKTPKIEEQNDFVDVEIYRFGGTQKSSKDKILELLKANSKSTECALTKISWGCSFNCTWLSS